jgi:excinuclease UvrABC nuclease subunit
MHEAIFDQALTFDPAADFEAFLKQLPAKWAVYLLADSENRPVQLLCVKNLRYSVERRLGETQEESAPSRRVNYRELVRRIFWRRVDSSFEADLVYLQAARVLFPQSYQNMVGFRPAWFVHLNPEAQFPRYIKTTDLVEQCGTYLGPLEEKQIAAKLIEQVEDWFDLCRYYHILVEAPRGRACAYKEMGKCPAPCDGSISMQSYRLLIQWSLQTLIDPAEMLRTQKQRMSEAAGELRFEIAAKIKTFIDQLSQLGKGPYRHLHRLEDFCYLSLQRGPREGLAKVYVVTAGDAIEVAGLLCEPARPSEIMRLALETSQHSGVMTDQAIERIGIVTHHLFQPKAKEGVFLHLSSIDEKSIVKAYRDLRKQKVAEETGEGVLKESVAEAQ